MIHKFAHRFNLFCLLLALPALAFLPLNGQTITVTAELEPSVGDLLTGTNSTITDAAPVIFNQTWNDGSDTFYGFRVNITDTASAAASSPFDMVVGGSRLFHVRKDGTLFSAVGFDGIGAVDLDFGSADITDFTFTTDGTGTAEFVIPDGSIDTDEILDGTIAAADLDAFPWTNADSGGTLGASDTTFAVTSNFAVITGDGGGNTVATITGGSEGQLLTLLFVDTNVTITDTDAHTANTVDLSAAFTSADDTSLTLISDGTSWYEVSRSVN